MKTQNVSAQNSLLESAVALAVGGVVYLLALYFPVLAWLLAAPPWSTVVLLGVSLLIGVLFGILKIRGAFLAALLGVGLSYGLYLLAAAYFQAGSVSEMPLRFIATLVGFALALAAVRFAKISWLMFATPVLLVAIYAYVPHWSARIDNVRYDSSSTVKRQEASRNLAFTVYKPSYVPSGMTLSPLKISGYDSAYSDNPRVAFSIDRIQAVEGGPLAGQFSVMNFNTNCDIGTLWSGMTSSSRKGFDVTRSEANPQPCTDVGKTTLGTDIYMATSSNGQWTYFYTRLGDNTNVMLEFDTINGEPYSGALLPQIVQTFNSVRGFPAADLADGTPF